MDDFVTAEDGGGNLGRKIKAYKVRMITKSPAIGCLGRGSGPKSGNQMVGVSFGSFFPVDAFAEGKLGAK